LANQPCARILIGKPAADELAIYFIWRASQNRPRPSSQSAKDFEKNGRSGIRVPANGFLGIASINLRAEAEGCISPLYPVGRGESGCPYITAPIRDAGALDHNHVHPRSLLKNRQSPIVAHGTSSKVKIGSGRTDRPRWPVRPAPKCVNSLSVLLVPNVGPPVICS
jgi:hypothetical protein